MLLRFRVAPGRPAASTARKEAAGLNASSKEASSLRPHLLAADDLPRERGRRALSSRQ